MIPKYKSCRHLHRAIRASFSCLRSLFRQRALLPPAIDTHREQSFHTTRIIVRFSIFLFFHASALGEYYLAYSYKWRRYASLTSDRCCCTRRSASADSELVCRSRRRQRQRCFCPRRVSESVSPPVLAQLIRALFFQVTRAHTTVLVRQPRSGSRC